MRLSPTKEDILNAAIAIVKVQGISGITMRQVATASNKSLSNLQYHFKSKQELIHGLVFYYFKECNHFMDEFIQTYKDSSDLTEVTKELASTIIEATEDDNDLCIVFREVWALANREKEIKLILDQYYKEFIGKVADFWVTKEASRQSAETAASFLIPFTEGYSITHNSSLTAKENLKAELSRILTGILCKNEQT